MDSHRSVRPATGPRSTPAWLVVALLLIAVVARSNGAQNAGERLIDREPFDRMTLDKVNENKVILLKPVPFPERRVPADPRPSEKLRVRLLENDQEYEIA